MRIAFLKRVLLLLWPLSCGAQSVTGGVTAGSTESADSGSGIQVGRIIFGPDGSVTTLPSESLKSSLPGLPGAELEGSAPSARGAELRFRRSGEELISADGRRYRRIGNTLFGSDGSTFLELGDRVIGSDGHRYRWVGAGAGRRLVRESASGTAPELRP